MIPTEVFRATAWPHAGFKTTGSSQPGWRRRRGVRRLHLLLSEERGGRKLTRAGGRTSRVERYGRNRLQGWVFVKDQGSSAAGRRLKSKQLPPADRISFSLRAASAFCFHF